jgi:hypothetical protein
VPVPPEKRFLINSKLDHWTKEPGARVAASRDLDSGKVQAPCALALPSGGVRLFYTAVGRAKPFPLCQGYILSALSGDGVTFNSEPGIRIAPRAEMQQLSLRAIAPCVVPLKDGRWRMYFEARGPANVPSVILSAISADLLAWQLEEGVRVGRAWHARAPRYLPLPDGSARLYFISSDDRSNDEVGTAASGAVSFSGTSVPPGEFRGVMSAVTRDGLRFEMEPGFRLLDRQGEYDSAGLTSAEVVAPSAPGKPWSMVYSAWQNAPAGSAPPVHPSHDPDAERNGQSEDFAAASIRSDLSGYRSRIFVSHSPDGVAWGPGKCIIEGSGYGSDDIDAVHAEDMSLLRLQDGRWRMYYAACDSRGRWCVASAGTRP